MRVTGGATVVLRADRTRSPVAVVRQANRAKVQNPFDNPLEPG